jgi:hypothetical protein
LDRSNIGWVAVDSAIQQDLQLMQEYRNARIAGMSKDLKLTSSDYDWLLTIFYISYIIVSLLMETTYLGEKTNTIQFEFQALMWKVVPPHYWAAFCVFAW